MHTIAASHLAPERRTPDCLEAAGREGERRVIRVNERTGKRRVLAATCRPDQSRVYQSYFTAKRMIRGPIIVDGSWNDEPPLQVMFDAASDL